MKNFIIALTLLLAANFSATAQMDMIVSEVEQSMSQGSYPAFTVLFQNINASEVEDRWEKFMKNYDAKGKKQKKSDEIFSDNAEIKTMSNNTVDVYAKVLDLDDDAQLLVWFDLGGAYLSSVSHPDKVESAQAVIMRFAKGVRKHQVTVILDGQKDKLKDLNKDLKKLKKDKEDMEGDISDWEKKIEEARQKIQENIKKQGDKQVEIETQETLVKETEGTLKKFDN